MTNNKWEWTPNDDEESQGQFDMADGWYLASVQEEDSAQDNTSAVKPDGTGGDPMVRAIFRLEDTPPGQEHAQGQTIWKFFVRSKRALWVTRNFYDALTGKTSASNAKLTIDWPSLVGRRIAIELETRPYRYTDREGNVRSGRRPEIKTFANQSTLDSGGI